MIKIFITYLFLIIFSISLSKILSQTVKECSNGTKCVAKVNTTLKLMKCGPKRNWFKNENLTKILIADKDGIKYLDYTHDDDDNLVIKILNYTDSGKEKYINVYDENNLSCSFNLYIYGK